MECWCQRGKKFTKEPKVAEGGWGGEVSFEEERGLLTTISLEGKLAIGDVVKGLMHRATLHVNIVRVIEGSFSKYPYPQSLTVFASVIQLIFIFYGLQKSHYCLFAKHLPME